MTIPRRASLSVRECRTAVELPGTSASRRSRKLANDPILGPPHAGQWKEGRSGRRFMLQAARANLRP